MSTLTNSPKHHLRTRVSLLASLQVVFSGSLDTTQASLDCRYLMDTATCLTYKHSLYNNTSGHLLGISCHLIVTIPFSATFTGAYIIQVYQCAQCAHTIIYT